jgi:hypothetical protein
MRRRLTYGAGTAAYLRVTPAILARSPCCFEISTAVSAFGRVGGCVERYLA